MRKLIAFTVGLFIACNTSEPTEVLVLPSLHGAHEMNTNYSYEDLMQIIKSYDPDVIGVEIRPEDMELHSDTLDIFYPLEMIRVRDSFPGKVTGIDYYSESVSNRPVSREMFTDSTSEMGRIKRLSQNMRLDSVLVSRYESMGIPEIQKEQQRIALTYSAEDFLKGEYDSLTQRQYMLEDSLFKNSIYEEYAVFNNRRDLRITQNALKLIEENPSKKILILVGANHRNRLVNALENLEVELVKDLSFMKE